ncbi:hypothetical protein NE237_002364 [Protea cynaroides]|uniref:HMA domain-containing protein n=1 Tax=Protea cynaroides TaxID=273540 RepID=A0A9Q0KUU8_9MAGN|nr:hypothetical protein NE237_002364 [Protea cynaroides]
MRQKIVVKVQMNHQNCRKKALQIAASIYGVDEMKIEGEDQLAVMGESVDSIRLVRRLRKKVGHAYILSLNEVTPDSQQQQPQQPQQQEQENSGSNPTYFPQGFHHPNNHFVEYRVIDDPAPSPCCQM